MKTSLKIIDVKPTLKEKWFTFDEMEKEPGVYVIKGHSWYFVVNSKELGILFFNEASNALFPIDRLNWDRNLFKKVDNKKILVEFSNE